MLAPSAALRARQGQLIISSPRQRLGAARAPWVRRAAAHGPRAEQPPPSGPSSLAADSVGSAASLERMYLLTAHDGAAPLVLLQAAARQQQPEAKQQQQQQQQPEGPPPEGPQHHLHVTEVCGSGGAGLHVCVEHTVNEDGHEVLPAEPLPGPEGALARLLDRMPLSRRARGIVMLNLLVLLVATNWVRAGGGRLRAVQHAPTCLPMRLQPLPAQQRACLPDPLRPPSHPQHFTINTRWW